MERVARSLAAAAELYGITISQVQMDGYLFSLRGKDPDDLVTAISIAIKECHYFPKISQILERIPTKPVDNFLPEPNLGDDERNLGRELFPLMMDYFKGKTSAEDWVAQMRFFAKKHGLENQMEIAIKKAEIIGKDGG